MKYVFIVMILYSAITADSLTKKYPSYRYVFNEFDVDNSYIYDADFFSFVIKNEKSLKSFYHRSLKRGQEILPTMKGLLLKDGVSDLFIYLSMVESGFSNTAISHKKAVGLWQFMPETAKRFKLEIDDMYDERYNTFSSTSAAINYLNVLHKKFGKWYLAAMAYNCGEGCLQRAIDLAGTDELRTLCDDRFKYLPQETRNYIKKILLVAMIGENSILNVLDRDISTLTEVEISFSSDLHKIASLLNMKYETLKKLNPTMKQTRVKNRLKKYKLIIPMEKIYAFYLRYELNNNMKSHLISHYVKLGETLASIAKSYNTSEIEIKEANKLEEEYLSLEQFLVIPVNKKIFDSMGKSKYKDK